MFVVVLALVLVVVVLVPSTLSLTDMVSRDRGHGDTFGKLELFFRSQRGCGGMPRVRSRNAANSQRQMLHQTLRSDEVRLNQLKLLGRFFGRPPDHPARIVSFDRFLQPRIWGHPTGPEEGS